MLNGKISCCGKRDNVRTEIGKICDIRDLSSPLFPDLLLRHFWDWATYEELNWW